MSKTAIIKHDVGSKAAASRKLERHPAVAMFLAGRKGKAERSDVDHKIGRSVMKVKDCVE